MSDDSEKQGTEAEGVLEPADEGGRDPLEDLKAEAQRYRDQLLRTAADFDNFRKRSRKELTDAEHKGREDLLKELLPVFDNLERAVAHCGSTTDVQALVSGIQMVLRQFTESLGKLGIERVAAVGEVFDPAVHEAIQHLETDAQPPGTIAQEIQAGYKLQQRLIRPALVVVAKGGAGLTPSSGEGSRESEVN